MTAPIVLDGPINGRAFQAYVDQVLVPELLKPADVVVMDNLGSATRAQAYALHRGGRREAALSPALLSPDFNPIENAFAKLKALLRKAAERPSKDSGPKSPQLLPAFSPSECANYFAAAGYDPT